MQHKFRHVCPPETSGYLVKARKFPPSRRKYFFRLNGAALTRHHSEDSLCREKIIVVGAICKNHSQNGFVMTLPSTQHVFYARNSIECNMWIDALHAASTFRLEYYYDVRNVIGQGGFAEVRAAYDVKTGAKVAVKIIKKSGNTDAFLQRELTIMRQLSHPHVVRTLDIFESVDKYHIVMEFLAGGSLFDIMKPNARFHETDVRQLMRQVLNGLVYIHSRGIVHRDLKPENILLCGNAPPYQAKIADFGLSNFHDAASDALMKTLIGTPQFVAPELVKNEAYGSEVDAWACGIIIFNMLTGVLPFSENEVLDKYRTGNFKIEYHASKWSHISQDGRSLTKSLLCVDASRRVNAIGALHHSWFIDSEFEDLEPLRQQYASLPSPLLHQTLQSQHRSISINRDGDGTLQQRNTYPPKRPSTMTNMKRFRKCVHAMRFLKRVLAKAGIVTTFKVEEIRLPSTAEQHALPLQNQMSGASVATESEWDYVVQDVIPVATDLINPTNSSNIPIIALGNHTVPQIQHSPSQVSPSMSITSLVTPHAPVPSINISSTPSTTATTTTTTTTMTTRARKTADRPMKLRSVVTSRVSNVGDRINLVSVSPACRSASGTGPARLIPSSSDAKRHRNIHPSGSLGGAMRLDRANTSVEPYLGDRQMLRAQQMADNAIRNLHSEAPFVHAESNMNHPPVEPLTPSALPPDDVWGGGSVQGNVGAATNADAVAQLQNDGRARRKMRMREMTRRLFGGLRGSRRHRASTAEP